MRVFVETQRFNQTWLWILIITVDVLFFGLLAKALYTQLYLGIPSGDNPVSDNGLIAISVFVFLLLAGITLSLLTSRLQTRIEKEGVSYKFTPFMRNWKNFPLSEIQQYEVKKFNPIMEFGGWGYRRGWGKLLVNTSGNIALFIRTTDNRQVAIGTQQPEEVKQTMQTLMNQKNEN